MEQATRSYYDKRGEILVKNLQKHHFEAYYCATKEEALAKAIELIPEGSTVGWGGAISAQQIGLLDAMNDGNYNAIDRDKTTTPEARNQAMRDCLGADYFITGANGISIDGQMVNIDGNGNRVAAIIYGPKYVVVVAGMNKVCDSIEDAVVRARTVAAPMNQLRFSGKTPCTETGNCADCLSEGCICNQIVITRNCRPAGRIKFILVGEELGF
jgi:L-lactate utilization protein LutB